MDLATFVKKRRKLVHPTQEEFAEGTGVTLTVVRKIEQGKTNLNMEKVNLVFDVWAVYSMYHFEGLRFQSQTVCYNRKCSKFVSLKIELQFLHYKIAVLSNSIVFLTFLNKNTFNNSG